MPPELDDAVRVALERDPDARYPSALEMAEAIEAGLHGEATEATQRLGDERPTTPPRRSTTPRRRRAMQRTTLGPQPTRVHDGAADARPVTAARARRAAARARRRRRRWGSFLALLAAIAAIAIVAIALLSSSDGGSSVDSVDTGDVQQQIDGLRDFIGEHSR